ncbi:MAG: aminotransferase class IV, partial [Balneolaceae bacterium]|nr:aminotransferase class IV [Balneolaceae bacterium]
MNDSRSIYFNGGFRSESEPLFTGNARSVMYGDGCFETFRSYGGRYFHLGDHMRRLQEGLNYLGITVPGVLTKGPEFLSLLDQLLERNDMQDRDALVRIQVSRRGSRGYRTGDSEGAHLVIASYPTKTDYGPIALATAGIRRIPAASMPPQFKFTNGINYILAASEAVKKGADDALMLTIDGSVS